MGWQQSPYLYPALIAAVVSTGLAVYGTESLRKRDGDAVVVSFVVLSIAIAVWTWSEAIAYARTDLATKLFWYRIGQMGAVAASPAWLFFGVAYTDRDRWITPFTVILVSALPAAAAISLWTAPFELAISEAYLVTEGDFRYLFVSVGPSFWLFRAYGYVLVTLGTVLLIGSAIRTRMQYRGQTLLLVGSPLLPFAGELASTFGLLPDDHVNYAALLLSASTLGLGIVVFRYRLFDVRPIARATVFKKMRDGIVVADEDGKVVDLNRQARELLDAKEGKDVKDVVPDYGRLSADDTPETVEAETGDSLLELSRKRITRQGRQHGWILTVRDITSRKQREKRIDRQSRRLEQLAQTVSHDLEAPLDIAAKWLDLLRDEVETDEEVDEEFVSEGIDELQHANRRIDAIADDLVALTRAETDLETEKLKLADVAHLAWHTVDAPSLKLEVDEDTIINADESRLLRLLENLFRNVIEHADGAMTVRAGGLEETEGFYVEDDGDGVPESRREKAIQHGYSTKSGGSGLGLTVVEAIAEAHGWEMRLTDSETGGARFEFTRGDVGTATAET